MAEALVACARPRGELSHLVVSVSSYWPHQRNGHKHGSTVYRRLIKWSPWNLLPLKHLPTFHRYPHFM